MLCHHILLSKQIINNSKIIIKINLFFIFFTFIIFYCFFFMQQAYSKLFDKPMSFYDEARNNAENSVKIVNTPIFLNKNMYWLDQIWVERNCVMYNMDYHNLSTCGTGNITDQDGKDFKDTEKYYNKQPFIIGDWIYSPMIGKYLRFVAMTYTEKYGKSSENTIAGFYQLKNKEMEKYNKLDLNEESINRLQKYRSGMSSSNLALILWDTYIGNNCEKVWGENRIACYNELDIHDYDRFYFNGDEMTKYDLKYYIREYKYDNIKKEGIPPIIGHKETYRNEMYEQTFNVKTIWKGKLKENETLTDLLKNMINNSKRNKILIMVPKDQRKLFIKTIKQIPDNYFKDKVGYVWFLSDSTHYNNIDKPKYNTKYDTKPNDKYDAELSRISGGKLKAKYGRYLTKERYSEDYIAPSIYGNNYNDEPEW